MLAVEKWVIMAKSKVDISVIEKKCDDGGDAECTRSKAGDSGNQEQHHGPCPLITSVTSTVSSQFTTPTPHLDKAQSAQVSSKQYPGLTRLSPKLYVLQRRGMVHT